MNQTHILGRTRVLRGIEPEALADLARASSIHRHRRGATVWQMGDIPKGFVVVAQGLVKVVRPGPNGRATICGIFGPGESVGDVALLRSIPYPASAISIVDTAALIVVPTENFWRCFERQPQLGMSFARGMADKLDALHSKIDVLSAGSVEARLATLILALYEKLGDDFGDGTSHVPLALSRRDLADLISTTQETTVRTMSRWERDGVVSTVGDGFRIHALATLRALSAGASETR